MGVYVVVGLLIFLDVVTGFIKASYNKEINSTVLRKGLYHKLAEILTVVLATLLEHGARYIHLGVDLPLLIPVCVYLSVMEIISITENLCEINPTLKQLFEPYLEKIKHNDKK